jgi:predicted nucleic acid-binding Zn ribbon protein
MPSRWRMRRKERLRPARRTVRQPCRSRAVVGAGAPSASLRTWSRGRPPASRRRMAGESGRARGTRLSWWFFECPRQTPRPLAAFLSPGDPFPFQFRQRGIQLRSMHGVSGPVRGRRMGSVPSCRAKREAAEKERERRAVPVRAGRCVVCGLPFITRRADRKFCGDRCRLRSWRQQQRVAS